MSLKEEIRKLKKLLEPKRSIRFVFDIKDVQDLPGVVWVVFQIG